MYNPLIYLLQATAANMKKKRKTVKELAEHGAKRLRQLQDDHVLGTTTIAESKSELAQLAPSLLLVVMNDPKLRAKLFPSS